MSDEILLTHKRLLLCEGNADKQFFIRLLKEDEITNIQVLSYGGGNFLQFLKALKVNGKFSTLEKILITGDKDDNESKAFKSFCKNIIANGFVAPSLPSTSHAQTGNYFGLSIEILLLPIDKETGALEKMFLEVLVEKSSEPLLSCIDSFVLCATDESWNNQKKEKLKLAALLAATHKRSPEVSYPDFISNGAGYPNFFSHPTFNTLRDYLIQFSKV